MVRRARVDPAAFATIYDHYFSRVYNYIRYRIGDPAVADDLTAQVFEQTLAKITRYDPERAPFAAWLFAIARNTINDYLRRKQNRPISAWALNVLLWEEDGLTIRVMADQLSLEELLRVAESLAAE